MTQADEVSIVADSGLAIKIGELLCEALYGDLARQNPLSAADKGTYWRVEGSWNRDGMMEGSAEFFLSIDKADGRVSDIGEAIRITPHPSIIPLMNQSATGTGSERRVEGPVAIDPSKSNSGSEIEPNKTADCLLLLTKLNRGGVVFSSELAQKIGEALCESRYADLSLQSPLKVDDMGTYWRVKGAGTFFASIAKYDGRVADISE